MCTPLPTPVVRSILWDGAQVGRAARFEECIAPMEHRPAGASPASRPQSEGDRRRDIVRPAGDGSADGVLDHRELTPTNRESCVLADSATPSVTKVARRVTRPIAAFRVILSAGLNAELHGDRRFDRAADRRATVHRQ
jgi:hypothetical protein